MFQEIIVHPKSLGYRPSKYVPIFYQFMFEYIKYLVILEAFWSLYIWWEWGWTSNATERNHYICKYLNWLKKHSYMIVCVDDLYKLCAKCLESDTLDMDIIVSIMFNKIFVEDIGPQCALVKEYFKNIRSVLVASPKIGEAYIQKLLKLLDFLYTIAVPTKQNARHIVQLTDKCFYHLPSEYITKAKAFILRSNDAFAMTIYYMNIESDPDIYNSCKNVPMSAFLDCLNEDEVQGWVINGTGGHGP